MGYQLNKGSIKNFIFQKVLFQIFSTQYLGHGLLLIKFCGGTTGDTIEYAVVFYCYMEVYTPIATPIKDILTLHYTLKMYKYSETCISDHLY